MHQSKLLWAVLLGLVSLFISAEVFAQADVIDKRKQIMKDNNAAIKAIKEAVEAKDYATIEIKAKEINSGLEKAADLFPKGSTSEKSRAHPDIWEKPDEFKKSLAKARKTAEALSKAAAAKDDADVNIQVKALGTTKDGACGECHKVFRSDFRKEKKE